MTISYEEAVKAQAQIEDKLLADPNVVSIGVIEATDSLGRQTGNHLIQVGVLSTEIYKNAVIHGQSVIPIECVISSNKDASIEKHIRIRVVKEGKIEIFSESKSFATNKNDLPRAMATLARTTALMQDSTSRRRSSPCGHRIAHHRVAAGTLGLLLKYDEGPTLGKASILRNHDTLTANNVAYVHEPVTPPAKSDVGIQVCRSRPMPSTVRCLPYKINTLAAEYSLPFFTPTILARPARLPRALACGALLASVGVYAVAKMARYNNHR